MQSMNAPYPSTRDSGLPWLGHIPAHWDVTKVKRGYDIRLGKMLRSEPLTPSDTLEPYLRAANIQWQDVDTNDVKEMWFSQWEKPLYELRDGDLMVCEGGDVGRAAIWQGQLEKCYIQNSVHRVRSRKDFINKFLYYWLIALKNNGYIDLLCNKATIAHFTAEKFAAIELIAPPLPEQRTIAAYLDRQTAKIDTLIAKKQRLVDLLAEQRAALISQAVTKGLNPNVEMKKGNRWIDIYPKTWVGLPLKRWVSKKITDGPHETPEFVSDGIPFISAEAVYNDHINFDSKRGYITQKEHERFCKKLRPQRDDIFMVKSGATTGKLAIVDTDEEFSVWSPMTLIRVDGKKITPKYLFHALHSDYIQNQVRQLWTQGTQPNISMGEVENIFVVASSVGEQEKIIEYLDHHTKRLNDLAAKVETVIERLQEYRSALISSAVTGKIQVKAER